MSSIVSTVLLNPIIFVFDKLLKNTDPKTDSGGQHSTSLCLPMLSPQLRWLLELPVIPQVSLSLFVKNKSDVFLFQSPGTSTDTCDCSIGWRVAWQTHQTVPSTSAQIKYFWEILSTFLSIVRSVHFFNILE